MAALAEFATRDVAGFEVVEGLVDLQVVEVQLHVDVDVVRQLFIVFVELERDLSAAHAAAGGRGWVARDVLGG